jgi:hypothetical protein
MMACSVGNVEAARALLMFGASLDLEDVRLFCELLSAVVLNEYRRQFVAGAWHDRVNGRSSRRARSLREATGEERGKNQSVEEPSTWRFEMPCQWKGCLLTFALGGCRVAELRHFTLLPGVVSKSAARFCCKAEQSSRHRVYVVHPL